MITVVKDNTYGYSTLFNTKTGSYLRGFDVDFEPFMAEFPHLIDVGVMGHCEHGRSGLCMKAGVRCYQDGLHVNKPNMLLEDYKRIVDECKGRLFQVALGGAGDPDMHENFEEILKYSVENNIVPNFTTSGLGITVEKAKLCKKYCGAVAVSQYSRLDMEHPTLVCRVTSKDETYVYRTIKDISVRYTFGGFNPHCLANGYEYLIDDKVYYVDSLDSVKYGEEVNCEYILVYHEKQSPNYTMTAIRMLQNAGVKVNIHYVLSNGTIDEALFRLKNHGFPFGINAVIFLLHKPVGLGQMDDVLDVKDPKVKEFFELVDKGSFGFKVGFDSCSIPGILRFSKNIDMNSLDTCEGGRYSMYITSDMIALPCSFDNQKLKYGFDLRNGTIKDAWDSAVFDSFRSSLRNSCPNCSNRENCMGGCPLERDIVLCDRKEKDLYEV